MSRDNNNWELEDTLNNIWIYSPLYNASKHNSLLKIAYCTSTSGRAVCGTSSGNNTTTSIRVWPYNAITKESMKADVIALWLSTP